MRSVVAVVVLLAVTAPIGGAVTAANVGGNAGDATEETAEVTITVTVVDQNGNGIGDADVTVEWDGGNKTRTTAGNGKAFVTVPEDRELQISVDHPSYVKNIPETVSNVGEDEEITVRMTPPATETVTILDADGKPVEDARVSLIKSGQIQSVASGETDENGKFTAENVEEGEYGIRVRRSGFDNARIDVDVAGTSEHTVEIERNSTQVSFRIIDGRLGEGIQANVKVRSDGEEILSFRTDGNGRGQQLLPVNSWYRIVVERDGYESTRQRIRVNQDDRSVSLAINRTNDLTLDVETTQVLAGNSFRVTVSDEYGDRVSGATITVDGESVATTDADGSATVRLDEPGRYDLVASDGSVDTNAVTVRAVEAATTTAVPTTTEATTTEATTTEATTTEATTTTAPPTTTSAADTSAATTEESDGGSPGFVVPTALGGLLAGLLFLRRRR